MTLRIRMTGVEAAKVRFALSPLTETVLAARALTLPQPHAVHARWRRHVVTGPGPLLGGLVSGCMPSFLMSVPAGRSAEIGEELDRLRATPLAFVESELAAIAVDLPAEAVLARLADELADCHEALIAPHWERMRAVLDADIAEQAVRLAEGGIQGMFSRLHEHVAWSEGELVMSHCQSGDTLTLAGRGLVLTPSVFAWPRVLVDRAPRDAGSIIYPAMGAGQLWAPAREPTDALASVLGRTRAALIEALAEPLSTGELAARLNVTPGAVSQHLGALRTAGLVQTRRRGRTATHVRTELATGLTNRPG